METTLLDKYPWAANHQHAIQTIRLFMNIEPEFALMQFDSRLLNKVAKDHLQQGCC